MPTRKTIDDKCRRLFVKGLGEKLKPLGPSDSPAVKLPKGALYVDTKAVNEYIRIKRDLEKNHFPKVKITFGHSPRHSYTF